jgi:hypothetical protein
VVAKGEHVVVLVMAADVHGVEQSLEPERTTSQVAPDATEGQLQVHSAAFAVIPARPW